MIDHAASNMIAEDVLRRFERKMSLQRTLAIAIGVDAGVVLACSLHGGPDSRLPMHLSSIVLAAIFIAMGVVAGGTLLGAHVRKPLPGDLRVGLTVPFQAAAAVAILLHAWTMIHGR